jgi:hypothetical protein
VPTYKRAFVGMAGAVCLLVTGCQKAVQSREAVEKGVTEYLENRAGLDIKSMDVKISSVSFRAKEAEATVHFQAKGSTDPAGSMQMRYVLEQKDGKWVVKGRSGMSEHGSPSPGGGGGLPPGHPPTPATGGSKQ